MTFRKLNPNHPVTQQMDEGFMYKIVATLCARAGGKLTITAPDIVRLDGMFPGEVPTLCMKTFDDRLEFWLVPESEGHELVKQIGGLPI